MDEPEIDKIALKQAAEALLAAIAAFDPGTSKEAQMVLGFVTHAAPIDDALHGRIDQPVSSLPNASRALDGALQGYPQLEAPYVAFTGQLQGRTYLENMRKVIERWQAGRSPE